MSFDVFISYSTKDVTAAKAACAALEAAKIRCWMAPRDIVPGAQWGASIVRAINQCRVMVLIFSGNANNSSQVQREVDQAFSKAKTVVPLRIEDIKPADELAYYLDTVHWLDALTLPLEKNLEKLVATVQALLPTTEPAPAVSDLAIDEVTAARAQEKARAADEQRLKEVEAAEATESLRREKEAAEATRRKQQVEEQRVAAERRQREEDGKRRTDEERRNREDAEEQARAEQESAFAEAKRANTIAALDSFVTTHPESHLTAEAKSLRMALLERNEACEPAMAGNNPPALKTFADQNPKGKMAEEVRARLPQPDPRSKGVSRRALLIGGGAIGGSALAAVAIVNHRDRLIRTLVDPGFPLGVTFAPDGGTALSGGHDKLLKLWDLASGQTIRTFTGHTGFVHCVAVAPDGRTAMSGSEDSTLKLWDLASGDAIRTFTGHSSRVYSVAFTPDGRRAVSASGDHTLKLWDLANGSAIRTFLGHSAAVPSVAVAPDGRMALSAGGDDKTLKLWDLASGSVIRTFTGHTDAVNSVAFAPAGTIALSGSSDRTLRLWDVASGAPTRAFTAYRDVWSVAIAPDGRTAISGGEKDGDGVTVRLWDLNGSSDAVRTFTWRSADLDSTESVAIAPDGRTALSASDDGALRLWDLTLSVAWP